MRSTAWRNTWIGGRSAPSIHASMSRTETRSQARSACLPPSISAARCRTSVYTDDGIAVRSVPSRLLHRHPASLRNASFPVRRVELIAAYFLARRRCMHESAVAGIDADVRVLEALVVEEDQ